MKVNVILTIMMIVSNQLYSQNNWKSVNVQGMGYVTGVIANPSDQNAVFVRTDVAGMFSWDNGSQEWHALLDSANTSWNYMQVESFAIDKNTTGAQTVIYAAANGSSQGILKSTNRGESWAKTTFPDSVYINGNGFWRHTGERLMIDPQNSAILYFGSREDGLYKSTNGGGTWSKSNSLWTDGGTGGSNISGGISFVTMDPRITQIMPSPNRSKNLYLGVIGNTAHSYSMYKSTDGNSSWSVMNGAGAPANTQNPVRGVVASDGTLYITTTSNAASTYQGFPNKDGKIYKFNPTTNTWSDITPSGCSSGPMTYGCVSWAALAVDPNNPNKIYASIYEESPRDVFYSINGGTSWKIVTDDEPSPYPANTHQKAQYNIPSWGYAGNSFKFSWSGGLAVDPFNSNKIYITTGYAVHVTDDITLPTVTWNTPMKGLEMLVAMVVKVPAKLNGAELISGVADVLGFRHPDKSSTPPTKFETANQGITTSIDWMQTNPDVIVKVGGDPGSNYINSNTCLGCGYSVDNGISWTPFTMPAQQGWGAYVNGNISIARNAANNSSLNLVWFPTAMNSGGNANKPVFSINSGLSWTESTFDFGNVTQNSCTGQYWFNSEMVASDKVANNTFYAFVPNWFGSQNNYCQLFRSTNGGRNFTKIYSSQKQFDINGQSIGWTESHLVTLKPNPLVAGDVWIKIGTNLFRCQNALGSVTEVQPDIQKVNQTVITRVQNFGWGAPYPSSNNPTLFVAGTINGIESVFRSTDLGVTWTDILMGEHIYLINITTIDGDMNRPGKVFVGTGGRGIFYFEDPLLSNNMGITSTIDVDNVSCFGGSNGTITLTVSGGNQPYTFKWGNGITTQNRTGLAAGTYTVTITDIAGQIATQIVTVSQPVAISTTSSVTDVTCFNTATGAIQLNVTGGTGMYTFLWNDGSSTQNLAGLSAGIYSATITDAEGCNAETTTIVTQPIALVASTILSNIDCLGSSSGSIELVIVGGTAPYSVLWNNGASAQTLANITAGTYSATISDAYGCSLIVSQSLTQPTTALALTVTATPSTSANDGTASAMGFGGTAPYTFSWSNGGTSSQLGNLMAGAYTVTITDAKGCTATADVLIDVTSATSDLLGSTNLQIYPNPASDYIIVKVNGLLKSDLHLQLKDVDGKLVLETDMLVGKTITYLDIRTFHSGIYFLSIADGSLARTIKVVISH